MFMTSDRLKERLAQLERKARKTTHGAVCMEEYIALPIFEQIIVRFQTDDVFALEEVDVLEQQIQSLAGNEFLVDFMGSVYRHLGVEYDRLDEIFEKLGKRFANEPVAQGPYAKEIRDDSAELLCRCRLPKDTRVWEIQWENGEYSLLLLGNENRFLRTVEGDIPIHVYEVNESLCMGLMQAAFAARRMGVSLGRLMLEAMDDTLA